MVVTGRNILVGISLCLCAVAINIYLTEEQRSIVPDSAADNQAKVKISGFEFFRYQQNVLVERMAGKKAELSDPGKILFSGGMRAVRNREKRRDELTSGQALVQLKSENGHNVFAKASVDSIHLVEDVELRMGEWRMTTEAADYVESTSIVSGNLPVRVDSGLQFLAGDKGFEYNLKNETLRMRGGISGSVSPSELNSPAREAP